MKNGQGIFFAPLWWPHGECRDDKPWQQRRVGLLIEDPATDVTLEKLWRSPRGLFVIDKQPDMEIQSLHGSPDHFVPVLCALTREMPLAVQRLWLCDQQPTPQREPSLEQYTARMDSISRSDWGDQTIWVTSQADAWPHHAGCLPPNRVQSTPNQSWRETPDARWHHRMSRRVVSLVGLAKFGPL